MKKLFNSFQLKCITIAMMIGGIYLQQILYKLNEEVLAAGGTMPKMQSLLYHMGYVVYLAAFPVAAFLLVEAAKKTSDRKALLKRLLVMGLLVEIPMDMATFGLAEWKNWGLNQNYFFTLSIGLGVIMAVEALAKKYAAGSMGNNLLTLLVYLLAALIAVLGRTEQGSVGVLTVICLFLFYGNKMFSLVSVAALYILFMGSANGLEYLPVLGILLVWMYNGEQGKADKMTRLVFYAAFPVAYCVLGVIARFL
ncbi:MAG: hypothetical protein J6J44_14385 [Lachnospiraceae bacterium]|nr:hypothetical protein [Lachnospiraceae bacterium]